MFGEVIVGLAQTAAVPSVEKAGAIRYLFTAVMRLVWPLYSHIDDIITTLSTV